MILILLHIPPAANIKSGYQIGSQIYLNNGKTQIAEMKKNRVAKFLHDEMKCLSIIHVFYLC